MDREWLELEAECLEEEWNKMDFILTQHAKQRLFERKIRIEQVKETINFPDYTIAKENKIEAYKKFDKVLKVVYNKEGKFIKIITLIWK